MTSASDRRHIIALIDEATAAGARQSAACDELCLHERTLQRWKDPEGGIREDRRPFVDRPAPANRLTEEERVAAGLDAYDPDEVPPATDTPPQPEDITQNEDWQEERAEFHRQEDKGELGHINEHHPFPPTRYE